MDCCWPRPDRPIIHLAPTETGAQARQQVGTALTTMIGKRICTTCAPDGATLKASVTMDGAAMPQGTDTVLWVKPSDGYSVAP